PPVGRWCRGRASVAPVLAEALLEDLVDALRGQRLLAQLEHRQRGLPVLHEDVFAHPALDGLAHVLLFGQVTHPGRLRDLLLHVLRQIQAHLWHLSTVTRHPCGTAGHVEYRLRNAEIMYESRARRPSSAQEEKISTRGADGVGRRSAADCGVTQSLVHGV